MADAGPAVIWQAAVQAHQAGQLAEAEAQYRRLLAHLPEHAEALHMLGVLLAQTGRHREALPFLRQAMARQPRQAACAINLGEACRRAGLLEEAAEALMRALTLAPNLPEAHFNLGNVRKDAGQLEEALACYERAVQLKPNYANAYFNLGNTLRDTGRLPRAVAAFRQAVTLNPRQADVHLNLGAALLGMGDSESALTHLHRARELAPDHPELDGSLGDAYFKQGRLAEARRHYAQLLARFPERPLLKLRLEALPEAIPASNAAIDSYRADLLASVRRFHDEGMRIQPADLCASGAEPPMALAYQGRDDRPIKEAYAALFAEALSPLESRPRSGPPHVGFLVTHGHEGVFARCLGSLLERLSPQRLRVSLVSCRAGVNVLRHLMPAYAHHYVTVSSQLPEAAEQIRTAGINLLHYWEVGTDSFNYFLPFFRPAQRQSATWGWPVTSGNPRIDYFVSCELLESADAREHYREQLVLLPTLPTYYQRPPVPRQPAERGRWGVSSSDHLYLCVQNLRKYHPDFDPILAGILRADPAGRLLIIGDEQPNLTQLLLARMRSAMPDVIARVQPIGRLDREEYLGLVAAADVVLDTPHYGGGANSVNDAVAAEALLVTWPGRWHRSRYAAAVHRLVGTPELIADSPADYVQRTVRLAAEPELRHELRQRLRQNGGVLFEDIRAVHELEEWCLEAIG